MRSNTATLSRQDYDLALRGACEKSARSVLSVLRREAPAGTSPEVLMDFTASLTGVIERTTELLLAGKQVRVIEDDEAITTQEAADLLNVSRPHLVKLLDRGEIPPLPRVGRHRRVARASVLKYKRARDAQREAALKELAELSQRHGLGY
ncbi:MAG: excisionase family DNA-binding protein [Rhodoferax sp.]|uniref:excisionase family DNA-binding protein n=1 Tax=Rhodoferax sp. TaxID=50421 RepID=UPI003BB75449